MFIYRACKYQNNSQNTWFDGRFIEVVDTEQCICPFSTIKRDIFEAGIDPLYNNNQYLRIVCFILLALLRSLMFFFLKVMRSQAKTISVHQDGLCQLSSRRAT